MFVTVSGNPCPVEHPLRDKPVKSILQQVMNAIIIAAANACSIDLKSPWMIH